MAEIDVLLDGRGVDQEDELPPIDAAAAPVSRPGDLWLLGEHRLLCGDALQAASYARLLGTDKADMMFADPPYNVPVEGHVSGLGAVKHTDFAMASGELSSAEFQTFLRTSLGHAAMRSVDGAVHFVCMDWRHLQEVLAAGEEVYSELKNLCVRNKSNAGMGSLYRSKHELIFVFKVGKCVHVNNIALGRYGRHRTNVWDYVSQNALNGTKKGKLALHPTVKPVAMIADAIRHCSEPRRPDSRSLRGRRHDPDCGGTDRPPCSRDRAEPDVRRHQHRALAAADRRYRDPRRWGRAAVRTGPAASRPPMPAREGECPDARLRHRPAAARKGDGTKSYEVGYGKPPTHCQFPPGNRAIRPVAAKVCAISRPT